mmetsp:Transcript_8138/g.14154  ORF Transcript_8138/g.14154 Transcript_8138/m.14154 type:complete len:442 (+) Transcript_8138:53-1378(+)
MVRRSGGVHGVKHTNQSLHFCRCGRCVRHRRTAMTNSANAGSTVANLTPKGQFEIRTSAGHGKLKMYRKPFGVDSAEAIANDELKDYIQYSGMCASEEYDNEFDPPQTPHVNTKTPSIRNTSFFQWPLASDIAVTRRKKACQASPSNHRDERAFAKMARWRRLLADRPWTYRDCLLAYRSFYRPLDLREAMRFVFTLCAQVGLPSPDGWFIEAVFSECSKARLGSLSMDEFNVFFKELFPDIEIQEAAYATQQGEMIKLHLVNMAGLDLGAFAVEKDWRVGELNCLVEGGQHSSTALRRTMIFKGKAWNDRFGNVFKLHLSDSFKVVGTGGNRNGTFTVSGTWSETGEISCNVTNQHGVWPITVRWNPSDSTLVGETDAHDEIEEACLKAVHASGPRVFLAASRFLFEATVLQPHETFRQAGVPAHAVLTLVKMRNDQDST